jgi:hypothetical protein
MQTLNQRLKEAVYEGKYNTVRGLIKDGANSSDEMVELAVRNGHTKIANFLSKQISN